MDRFRASSLLMGMLAILLAVLPCVAHAARSYDNCTGFITSVPAVISTHGTWCLNRDLATAMTAGKAIDIQTSDVTVDCKDFKLDGLAAGANTRTVGIYAFGYGLNKVRNCAILGFYYGVFLKDNNFAKDVVENSGFQFNIFAGILVKGDGSVVRHNRLLDSGYEAILTYDAVDIIDNTITGVGGIESDIATGIATFDNLGGNITRNRIRGLLAHGQARGVYNVGSSRLTVRHNDVVANGGSGSSFGIACTSAGPPDFNTFDTVRDNVISGFAIPIAYCADNGGNAVIP